MQLHFPTTLLSKNYLLLGSIFPWKYFYIKEISPFLDPNSFKKKNTTWPQLDFHLRKNAIDSAQEQKEYYRTKKAEK